MCGVGAILSLTGAPVPDLAARLDLMNTLQRHRGPDGVGAWAHPSGRVGLAHRRLSIIDIEGGAQPMGDAETMAGASRRAREALSALPGADIGIGLEAGIDEIDGRL